MEITRLIDACGEGSACPSSWDPFLCRGKVWEAKHRFFFFNFCGVYISNLGGWGFIGNLRSSLLRTSYCSEMKLAACEVLMLFWSKGSM